jgi:uncharacterized protein (DUF983 family)
MTVLHSLSNSHDSCSCQLLYKMPVGLIQVSLNRGWHRRCPHCGHGALFTGWAHPVDRCDHCGLVYERNQGDTWFFTIIGDRIPVAALIILIYFGLARSHPLLAIPVFVSIGLLLLWTAPNRWGVGIALHYVSRVLFPDPDDPFPPRDPPGSAEMRK